MELLAKDNNRELVFTIEDDDNEFGPDERLKLENVFQLLAFDLEPALFQYIPSPSGKYYKQLLDIYKITEPIDEAWTTQVNALSKDIDQVVTSVKSYVHQQDISIFNKVYQYILYRQIDMLADYSLEAIIGYAKDGTEYMLMTSAIEGNPLKQIARWSQQIEYDEDNVELLLQHYETLQ